MLLPVDFQSEHTQQPKRGGKKTFSEEVHKQLHGMVVTERKCLDSCSQLSVLSGEAVASLCCPILTYNVKMVSFPDCTRVIYRDLSAMMV